MSLEERKKLSTIYRIEDGIIYYNYFGKIFSREVCPEIVELLTRKRKVTTGGGGGRYMTILFENELRSINNYITMWDMEFKLIPPYRYPVIRGVGSIEIKVNNKLIK